MTKRIIAAEQNDDEVRLDRSLRPLRFGDFVGQDRIKENLRVFIKAARGRGEALDHVLFCGPPGLGKTTLANIIAHELGVGIKSTSGPVLDVVSLVPERPEELTTEGGLNVSANRKALGPHIEALKKAGIDPAAMPGYEREVTTHIAVALAVKSGEADAGMCVYSAAKALGLPFVPVAQERYELAFRKEHREDPRLLKLINTIQSPEFSAVLGSLGGYDSTETGMRRTVG